MWSGVVAEPNLAEPTLFPFMIFPNFSLNTAVIDGFDQSLELLVPISSVENDILVLRCHVLQDEHAPISPQSFLLNVSSV